MAFRDKPPGEALRMFVAIALGMGIVAVSAASIMLQMWDQCDCADASQNMLVNISRPGLIVVLGMSSVVVLSAFLMLLMYEFEPLYKN